MSETQQAAAVDVTVGPKVVDGKIRCDACPVLCYIRDGASGACDRYANKGGDPVQLIAAVKTVVEGRKYLTPEVAQLLADSLAQPTPELPHESLSERELQTLVKIASGKRLSDIAEELMLSPKTVSVYRARVLEKLKLANNAELTVYAIRNRLV